MKHMRYCFEVLSYNIDLIQHITPSRHFTLVFNCFVFLQIFNFVNARKLQDEINIFQGENCFLQN